MWLEAGAGKTQHVGCGGGWERAGMGEVSRAGAVTGRGQTATGCGNPAGTQGLTPEPGGGYFWAAAIQG